MDALQRQLQFATQQVLCAPATHCHSITGRPILDMTGTADCGMAFGHRRGGGRGRCSGMLQAETKITWDLLVAEALPCICCLCICCLYVLAWVVAGLGSGSTQLTGALPQDTCHASTACAASSSCVIGTNVDSLLQHWIPSASLPAQRELWTMANAIHPQEVGPYVAQIFLEVAGQGTSSVVIATCPGASSAP